MTPRFRRFTRLALCSALLLVVLGLSSLGCGIETTVTTTLPPVDAIDDETATSKNQSVNVFVLANDDQDDDLVTSVTDAVEMMGGATQVGSVDIDFFTFPEQVTYTPPADFTGIVTFTYTITGLGTVYDYTSNDTATVTVTVTEGLPDVTAVDDFAMTDINQAVVIDVLMNDSEDANTIDSFSNAFDGGTEQLGSVTLQTNDFDELVYTPPMDFEGTVSFDYTIVGAGVDFAAGSMTTAQVTVDVEAVPTTSILQFEDASGMLFEILLFFAGQDAIDENNSTAQIFQSGDVTGCFEGPVGVDVAVQARLLLEDEIVVDGLCDLVAGQAYTVRVQPDSPLDVVCVPGLAEPTLCD